MAATIEAVYECGVLRPLQPLDLPEGQRVALAIEPVAAVQADVTAQLREWQKVYEGLSEDDIAEVEAISLDRTNFTPRRASDSE